MHRANQHVDPVALHQLVGILRRFGWLRFVVDREILDLASGELAAALGYGELKAVGDGDAELRIGSRIRQHQADADLLHLRQREARR